MEDVSSETAVLVEYWRLLGAILGPHSGPLVPFWGPLGAITDRREALRERIQSDLHVESPPKSVCGGCIQRNGRSGRVLEASWRHLSPL